MAASAAINAILLAAFNMSRPPPESVETRRPACEGVSGGAEISSVRAL
jgi:hypothetical protein